MLRAAASVQHRMQKAAAAATVQRRAGGGRRLRGGRLRIRRQSFGGVREVAPDCEVSAQQLLLKRRQKLRRKQYEAGAGWKNNAAQLPPVPLLAQPSRDLREMEWPGHTAAAAAAAAARARVAAAE